MANYTTSLKSWGASGSEFPDGYSYVEGEQPVDAWDNFFNSNVYSDLNHLINLTNARLADENGSEASAGGVRLQNQEWVKGRNNADSADVDIWQVNSGDEIRAGAAVRLQDDLIAINGEILWDESESYIPQARLENDSLSVNSGTGLSGGGSVALNGSTSLSLDESYAATWSSQHTFQSGVNISSGELQMGGTTTLQGVVASGQVTLSSGEAVIDTGVSAVDATLFPAVGTDDPNADTKVAARHFWDDSAGTYKVEFIEVETTVGNPTVNYDILRVR